MTWLAIAGLVALVWTGAALIIAIPVGRALARGSALTEPHPGTIERSGGPSPLPPYTDVA